MVTASTSSKFIHFSFFSFIYLSFYFSAVIPFLKQLVYILTAYYHVTHRLHALCQLCLHLLLKNYWDSIYQILYVASVFIYDFRGKFIIVK